VEISTKNLIVAHYEGKILEDIFRYEGPEKATRGGVNGSQSKFLSEYGLCPKINPKPLSSNSARSDWLQTSHRPSEPG
jgi:hypothetical protein